MTKLSLRSVLTRLELQREKAKDYRNVVILQILIIGFGLTLSGPIIEESGSQLSKFIISIFSFFGALYSFLLWDLLRNFTKSKVIILSTLIVLSIIVLTGILTEFPYYQVLEFSDRQTYLLILHGALFPIELIVIGFAIRDIFSGSNLTPDKLWGAACVFLMVGISFGSLYDLISIAKPGSLGVSLELGLPNYSECVTFSMCILGGIDHGLEPSRLVRNISAIESVWGVLYGMLIIGKLLSLPRLENPTK
ncbi:MAG: hypothetical protein HC811_07595 [Flammeovirgaceae bacterium]|nr:hypothetical protein [Flammeovirgaceae bacterium]